MPRERFDACLVIVLAMAAGAGGCVCRSLACVVLVVLVGWLFWRRLRVLGLVAIVAAGSAFVRTDRFLARHETARLDASAVHGLTRCEGRGEVVERPVRSGESFVVRLAAADLRCGSLVRVNVVIALYTDRELVRGDEVVFAADLAPSHRFLAIDGTDPRPRESLLQFVLSGSASYVEVSREGRGLGAAIDRARHAVRRTLFRQFPRDVEALARALVLGENDLEDVDRVALRDAGLLHLLAVSGMHLVLVVGLIAKVLAFGLARIPWFVRRVPAARAAAFVTALLAFLYTDFAGGSGSARRAAWAFAAVALGRVFGLRASGVRAYALSLAGILVLEPWFTFDLSFALSAAATGGLLFLAPRVVPFVERRLGPLLAKPFSETASAEIACLPIALAIAPRIPLVAMLTNLIAAPLGELCALPSCLVVAVFGGSLLGEAAASIATGSLRVVLLVSKAASRAPFLSPFAPESVSLLALFAAVAFFSASRRYAAIAAVAFAVGNELLATHVRARPRPTQTLEVIYFDVAQGDSALVLAPDGQTMLVDGGGLVGSKSDPGERVVLRALGYLRRGRVDVVVLTHPHPDHFLGLRAVLREVSVGELWDTGQGEREGIGGAYAELLALARARGVVVRHPGEICRMHEWAGLALDALAPCPDVAFDRGANDNSFVFRLRHLRRAFLFVGDAEHEEEELLLSAPAAPLAADVLKVGHHGSRTSTTPAFLRRVGPRLAIASLGVRNRFGHPHPEVETRLRAARVPLLRTDRDGAIRVRTDGTSLEVTTAAESLTRRVFDR